MPMQSAEEVTYRGHRHGTHYEQTEGKRYRALVRSSGPAFFECKPRAKVQRDRVLGSSKGNRLLSLGEPLESDNEEHLKANVKQQEKDVYERVERGYMYLKCFVAIPAVSRRSGMHVRYKFAEIRL